MTNVGTNLVLAFDTMRNHRLRTALTVLGLTMGVAVLIMVITLILGANTYVEDKIANLGTNVFRIGKMPFTSTSRDEYRRAIRHPKISMADVEGLRARCPLCTDVGANASSRVTVRYKNQELTDVSLRGQTANMIDIGNVVVERGRFFTDAEDRHGAAVCVIGDELSEQLFPNVESIGKTIRVGHETLMIIGTFERIGSVLGENQDSFLVIPLNTFFHMRGARFSLTMEVKTGREEGVFEQTLDQAWGAMRAQRGLAGKRDDDFYFGTAAAYMALWDSISASFFFVFISVSSIAAVVGGIVIMNIMLVSVTERTKEVGVRRACGANRGDILRQFLAESVVQAALGGVLGVGIGVVAAFLVTRFSNFPASVEWWVAALGVAIASTVGIFFGLYPAMKAADLDPVEALRSE